MTVSVQETVFNHVGNGVTVTFAYNCLVSSAADLDVYVGDALTTTGFTISGIGSGSGGSVTFTAAPASGVAIRIERVVDLQRSTDYQQNGDFASLVVNPDFDRVWMALQQQKTELRRTLQIPSSEALGPKVLSSAANRANNLLGFDAAGNPVAVAPAAQSATALQILLATSSGAGLIGFSHSNTYSLGSLGSKAKGVVSAKDAPFNAVGDGVTNDTAALKAFFDYLATNGGVGVLEKGTYLSDAYVRDYSVTPSVPFTLYGAGKDQATIKLRTAANCLTWFNAVGVHINGIKIDGRYSTLGNSGHGLVFYNCNDCSANDSVAIDFKGTGFIGYTDSTTTGIVYERVFFRRCFAKATAAQAAGQDCNGVLLSDYFRGGIIECAAEDIFSFGIELKQNAQRNVVSNNRAKNCGIGFGMGQTTVGSDGCDYNTVTNFIAEDCLQGGVIGEGTHNLISDFLVDMTNVTQANQIDGFRLSTDAANNTILGMKTKGMRKPALRFITGASNNYCELAHCMDVGGAFEPAAHDLGADNNFTRVGHIEGSPDTIAPSSSGTGNKVFYERGQTTFGFDKYRWIAGASGGSTLAAATHIKDATSGVIEQIVNPANGAYTRNIGNGATTTYASETVNTVSGYWQFTLNAASYRFSTAGFNPVSDNSRASGGASTRWSTVYAGTATINTSDEREKQQIQDIDAAAIRAVKKINFRQFKFNDAVQAKGDAARWHFGVIAQQVKVAFESEGLDPFAYGVLCYDEWPEAVDEWPDEFNTDGTLVREAGRIVTPAGNRYGVRYEELICLKLAALGN